MLDKNLHYLSFNVHALLRQLVYSITSFSVCQDFFKSFLKKFLTSSQPEHFSSPCSLALSTDDLIIIHSITPFVNTFFHFFELFFIVLYIVDYFLLYTLFVSITTKKRTATNRYSSQKIIFFRNY